MENKPPQSTMSKIGNFFRGNKNIVKYIQWKQPAEREEWVNKAVDGLIKKLKKQPGAYQNLENALRTRSSTSECVTIPRTIDGRLQVMHCKALPHVIYCRIWRFPDLQTHHELKAVKACHTSNNPKRDVVCINPYHYERVEAKVLPAVLVPRQSEYVAGYSMLPNQQRQGVQPAQVNMNYANNGFGPVDNTYNTNLQCSSGMMSPMSMISNFSSGGGCQQPNYQSTMMDMDTQSFYQQENNACMQYQQEMVPVHYEEQENWALVSYYELNARVGEQFRSSQQSYSLIVDGYTYPMENTTNRFSLGQLSNVHRNSTVESTRKHIGRGVQVYYENNEVHIRCLSDAPVFIHSLMGNQLNNFQPEQVCKLLTNESMKVFDTDEFARLLKQVVNDGFEASFKLTRMCTIRLSFVKGWGSNYNRKDITMTPCWIEIHLNGPLKWLDEVLCKMGSPLNAISSCS